MNGDAILYGISVWAIPVLFAITFHDPDRDVLGKLHATIGDTVTIKVTPPGGSPETLMKGEVTGFEAEYGATRLRTVIRGYDMSHRLHRGRRTETYKNVTDSDIARTVASRKMNGMSSIITTSDTCPSVIIPAAFSTLRSFRNVLVNE